MIMTNVIKTPGHITFAISAAQMKMEMQNVIYLAMKIKTETDFYFLVETKTVIENGN